MILFDWEQRKLGEIVQLINRKNVNLTSTLPLTISAQYGLIDQRNFFDKQIASEKLEKYILLKKGEFAYNKSYSRNYPFGAIKRLNNYKFGALSTLYIAFKPVTIDTEYLEQYFDSTKWYKEIYKRATEGARNHGLLNISSQDFFNSLLTIPLGTLEQKQIAKLLKTISSLLDLQQRKLNSLFQYKTQFVNDIFEKQSNSWKTKRLNEFLHVPAPEISNVTTKEQIMTVKLNVGGVVSGANRDTLKLSATKYYVRHAGQLIFGKQNFFNGSIAIVPQNMDGKVTSQDVPSLNIDNDKIDSYFLLYYLSRKNFYEHTEKFATGTGSKRLHVETLLNLKIKVPSINIQKQISLVISKINKDIQSEIKKLNMYKKIKQSLLQNMFI